MALTDTLPTADAGGLTVVDERLILAGLVAKNADGSPRVGVFPVGSGALVTGRASMGYDIAPFKGVSSRTGTGVELVANDAQTTVATTAAPGANSRIDVIWWRPQFTANTDPGNVPIFGVTQGTAAGVPSKPPIPDGAVELAWATVPSTATTTASVVITQSAPWTAAAGGVVPVRNATELAAFVAADGTWAHDIATGTLSVRRAGAWETILRPLSSFTPTVVGLTGVTTVAKYEQRGKLIRAQYEITRTVEAKPTAAVTLSLPTPVANTSMSRDLGWGSLFLPTGNIQYSVRPRYTGTQTVSVNFPDASGLAISQGSNLSATFPTTLAHQVGTTLYLVVEYERT